MSIAPTSDVIAGGQSLAIPAPHKAEPIRSSPRADHGTLDALPQVRQYEVNAAFGEANLIIYRILDKKTGDLIQQIPPEQLIEMARNIRELLQANQPSPQLDLQI